MGERKKDATDVVSDIAEYTADIAIGARAGTRGFQMRVNPIGDVTKACKVNVLTKPNVGRPNWVLRLDAPHPHINNAAGHVPHVNLNPKVNTRLVHDPHLAIPGGQGGLQAAQKTATVLKKVNKVLLPVAIALDVLQEGVAIYQDCKNDTSRNTVETTVSISGGWGGGFAGALTGSTLGSAIFPGIGTILGGIIGGLAGGIGGSVGAQAVTELIGDACEYNIEWGQSPCRCCRRKYKYRKYQRKDDGYCDECRSQASLK